MKKNEILEKSENNPKLLKVRNGKYFVRFPKLNVPVVMNDYFFKQIKDKVKKIDEN